MDEELDLFELLEILKNRWHFLASLVLIAVLVAGVFSFYVLEPVYEAEAFIIFKPNNQQSKPMVLSETAIAPYASLTVVDPDLAISVNNVVEVFRSRAVLSKVIDRVGLGITIPSAEFNRFANKITVEPKKGTTGVIIKARSDSPTEARDIVNALVTEGITVVKAEKAKDIQAAEDFLQRQLDIVGIRLAELEDLLGDTSNKASDINRQINTNQELYTVLSQKLLEMQVIAANSLNPIEFVEEAVEPINPVEPKKALNIAISAFLAGFAGVFWVFFQNALESRRTSSKELNPRNAVL